MSNLQACDGASRVVITDCLDHGLGDFISKHIGINVPPNVINEGLVTVEGFKWGYDIETIPLVCWILSDLVFTHSGHSALLRLVDQLMAKPRADGSGGGEAYVFFTHHHLWLTDKDMDFLTRAHNDLGLVVTRLVEDYTGTIFDSDPGDEHICETI
ncbi:Protein N-terminal and lysine N-methyltransferase efm7 [Coemansia sp. S146]|nr:Protein N-terminal and lysine N-methyltransferase efm7 [Coemansia sp. S146]